MTRVLDALRRGCWGSLLQPYEKEVKDTGMGCWEDEILPEKRVGGVDTALDYPATGVPPVCSDAVY